MRVGVKRNAKKGKLPKATRELAEVFVASLSATQRDSNHSGLRNKSSSLCDDSISSNDISRCNNRFWILQGKSVAMKIWEATKKLGVDGNLPDERCVEMIEEGKR